VCGRWDSCLNRGGGKGSRLGGYMCVKYVLKKKRTIWVRRDGIFTISLAVARQGTVAEYSAVGEGTQWGGGDVLNKRNWEKLHSVAILQLRTQLQQQIISARTCFNENGGN